MPLSNSIAQIASITTDNTHTQFSPESLGTSDESLLGNYCQNTHPPTPYQERVAERYYLQTLSRELLPSERVAQCLRVIAPHAHEVEIYRNPETMTAHYRNLLTCGRVWFCPVCSAKITEGRAQELQKFAVHWTQERGTMALITYTIRHNKEDSLTDLLNVLKNARGKLTQSKQWAKLKDSVLWYGSVTTTEINHGVNGWHPHLHELVFFDLNMPFTKATLEDKLKKRWQSAVRKAGGDAGYTAGVDYQDANTQVYRYIAKYGHQPSTNSWTIDREVTKAISKRAKSNSRTVWQLLDDYGHGDTNAGRLFQEYAHAIKGRNQLNWSRNLKAEYQELNTVTDEQIAEQPDDNSAEIFTALTRKQWYEIINLPRDVRGELLTIAGHGDKDALTDFLLAHSITLDIEF